MLEPLPSGYFDAPFGRVAIFDNGGELEKLIYLPESSALGAPSALTREVKRQLAAYLKEPAFRFDLPLLPQGTEFQSRVWQQLLAIPVGEVQTYGEMAAALGSAARAVGGACRRNPLPWVVPCHRVVASGSLGGFSGARQGPMLEIKRWLLCHEGAVSSE
ncbi:methylated-DNA--[protein]-cysteine S-methyltransferase [Corallincola luteus]|uniref:Methylated-DNA--[protein]-cysteine S-methyltransferase n=1 Tax=Corallincola luteus TaxID=1775177 RepID=A0ABY2AP61_9GAMM|nr:methylated-DNA--[protein]-cysteine S-methyltransferase [Corallincola luteus]TCI04983.1 methylated-DNA--[protein]-cysteine S-methyltransferase [Corallincola luteus]